MAEGSNINNVKVDYTKEQLLDTIVSKIAVMKEGEKSTIAYLVSTLGNVSCVELEPFTKAVVNRCEELGIVLDFSIFGDIYVGKPQNCVFIVKHKK